MTLTPDVLSAAASIVSSIVIVFTALAAFRQIAHMRTANEIQAFAAIVERWSAPATVAARDFVFLVPDVLRDPAFGRELRMSPPTDRAATLLPMLTLFEEIGTLLHVGIVSERAVMTNYAPTIVRFWSATEPAIRSLRAAGDPTTYRMFEHLAARAHAWQRTQAGRIAGTLETMPDTTLAA